MQMLKILTLGKLSKNKIIKMLTNKLKMHSSKKDRANKFLKRKNNSSSTKKVLIPKPMSKHTTEKNESDPRMKNHQIAMKKKTK